MARITVEDCVRRTDRFSLVLYAAQRVREIEGGSPLTIPKIRDKNPVIALREIGVGNLSLEGLGQAFVRTLQKNQLNETWTEPTLDEDPLILPSDFSDGVSVISDDELEDASDESEDDPLSDV